MLTFHPIIGASVYFYTVGPGLGLGLTLCLIPAHKSKSFSFPSGTVRKSTDFRCTGRLCLPEPDWKHKTSGREATSAGVDEVVNDKENNAGLFHVRRPSPPTQAAPQFRRNEQGRGGAAVSCVASTQGSRLKTVVEPLGFCSLFRGSMSRGTSTKWTDGRTDRGMVSLVS